MAVRSRRLFGPVLVGAGPTQLFTAEENVTATLMKSLRILNVTDEPATFDLCIGDVEEGNAHYWRAVVPARSLISDGEWCVLNAGEVITINVDQADALVCSASGAYLV